MTNSFLQQYTKIKRSVIENRECALVECERLGQCQGNMSAHVRAQLPAVHLHQCIRDPMQLDLSC
eukprot:6470790-Amphidinium_carterae.1